MQKVVVLEKDYTSFLLRGDEDEARFREGPLAGAALPRLLGEGWRVVMVSGHGGVLILERGER